MIQTSFTPYKQGMQKLIEALGEDTFQYKEIVILQYRLNQNIARTLSYGSTPSLEANRNRLLESINRLSVIHTGKSFYEYCALPSLEPHQRAGLDENERKRQALLEAYFKSMQSLLTAGLRAAKADSKLRQKARQLTLGVLERFDLDGARKGQVVQLLYETGLITQGVGVIFLAEADLQQVYLNGAFMVEAHLAGTNMERASMEDAHLEWARLGDANLAGAEMARVYLVAAHLGGTILTGARLPGAQALGANLAGADLSEADLTGANLQWAFLATSNLQGTNLARANLAGSELKGANLAHANLAGADLQDTHLTWTRLRGAIYDAKTVWPEEFDPQLAGAVQVCEG